MNIPLFDFLVAGLCTFRISLLFSKEYGPAGIFDKLRKAPPKKSDTARWIECLFCFSMTASAFVCVCLWLIGHRLHYAQWFLIWTSLSSVAIIINQAFTKGKL